MKNNKTTLILATSILLTILSFTITLTNVKATSGNQRWIEVRCPDLNRTVPCNDCISGTRICNDNECTSCLGGGSIQ